MVRPRVLRHRVTVLTLCPLGEPEIAIGHEPRIEPWLPRKSNRLPSFKSRRTLSLLENEPRERNSSPEKNLSNNREPSANSGLDTETKNFSTTGRRRSFFVDIPFYRTIYLRLRCMAIFVLRNFGSPWLPAEPTRAQLPTTYYLLRWALELR